MCEMAVSSGSTRPNDEWQLFGFCGMDNGRAKGAQRTPDPDAANISTN